MNILSRLSIEAEYPVTKILEAIRENRKKHAAEYKNAMDGYFKSMKELLEKAMKDIEAGKPATSAIFLQIPVDNSKNYDSLEKLFQTMVGGTVKLSSSEFDQIVCDNHDWAIAAKATNSMYLR